MTFEGSKLVGIKMKKSIKLLTMFLFTSGLVIAQSSNYSLNMKMVITSPDTQMIILNHSGEMDEAIEGYYRISRYDDPFYGQNASLQPGGFSFLDPNVFGGFVEFMTKKWIQNKFPVENIGKSPVGNGRRFFICKFALQI